MEISLIEYSNAFTDSQAKKLIAHEINLVSLNSFLVWRSKLIEEFKSQILELPHVSQNLIQFFYTLLDSEPVVSLVKGPCRTVIYHWPNGEPKLLHIWNNNILLTDNIYWLKSFKFLEVKPDNLTCTFRRSELRTFQTLERFDNTISLTHNDHFGHFVVDNMPLLALLEGPFSTLIPADKTIYSTYNPKLVIKELLHESNPNLRYFIRDDMETPKFKSSSYIFNSTLNYQLISSNVLCNAYLIDKRSKNREIKYSFAEQGIEKSNYVPKFIFLVRTNEYSTRVNNIRELTSFLERLGFIIVDPLATNLTELEKILATSEIVIAESGSTTLNAVWFCSSNCKIVSLVADELIFNTSMPMIYGGLPYILPFLNRIHIFIGESKTQQQTQSSNSCNYNCKELKKLLEKI